MMQLSPDQQSALDAILCWYFNPKGRKTMTLGGYAGTGKTTVIRQLMAQIEARKQRVAVCAFTGKAVSVLKSKGVPGSTMHRLLYTPESYCANCMRVVKRTCEACDTDQYVETRWLRVPFVEADLVIVDEASMLNTSLVTDLEKLADRVLYVGDHGQLEPIGNDPGLMREPHLRLEQIHRQAEGSSIIRFAHHLRVGKPPVSFEAADGVRVHLGAKNLRVSDFDAILCGYNKTRCQLNARVRRELGREGLVEVGERVICLHNDRELNLYNGMLATVTKVRDASSDKVILLDIVDDMGEERLNLPVIRWQFGQPKKSKYPPRKGTALFDYGYAMTVHKAQGSEWEHVAVFEQLHEDWSAERWRYTAATRASKRLDYFVSERASP